MLGHYGIGEFPLSSIHVSTETITLTDGLTLADAFAGIALANALVERMEIGGAIGHTIHGGNLIADGIVMSELMILIASAHVTAGIVVGDTLANTWHAINTLADALVLEGVVDTTLAAISLIVDAIVADDEVMRAFGVGLTDGVAVGDAAAHVLAALNQIADTVSMNDTLAPGLRVTLLLSDTVDVGDTLASTAHLQNALSDGIPLFATLQIDGGTFSGFCLNTETRGVSEYSNWPFESFARLGQSYFGAASDGVYLLEGDDDQGENIESYVRTAVLDLVGGKFARVPEAYLGYTSSGQLVLKAVVTDRNGTKAEYWYALTAQTAAAPRTGRIKLGRGLHSVYWQFELHNKDGADFSLDVLALHPLVLDRRI